MKTPARLRSPAALCLCLLALLTAQGRLYAQATPFWEAFNDHRPGTDTAFEATAYDMRLTGEGGFLRNINTGEDLPVSLLVTATGTPDDFGANDTPIAGSPADLLFRGKVMIGGATNPGLVGVRASSATTVTLVFTGLNPSRRYNFAGTACRGGSYNDRWTFFTLKDAMSFVGAHEDGSTRKNLFTGTTFPASGLLPEMAALNTGHNKEGSVVRWNNIRPSDFLLEDGTPVTGFTVTAEQYTGTAPFGNPSAAAYAYAFNAIYLAEVPSTGSVTITENPESQRVPAGGTASFHITAQSPSAISYQWARANPGSAVFAEISGATAAAYTTPALTVADGGARFHCTATSAGSQAVSGDATLIVDGERPTAGAATGSIHFNAVYVTFSEPMKLDILADPARYQMSGGVSVADAIAIDPQTVRVLTGPQSPGSAYTLTLSGLQDLAGNATAVGASVAFTAFSLKTGVVGIDIWKGILGGNVTDLLASPSYPDQPDQDFAATTFDSLKVLPAVPDTNTYGGRMRAWLTPAVTDDYRFFLRADDTAEVKVSLDDETFDSMDSVLPAATSAAVGPFQEPGFDLSTSEIVHLEAGRRYPVQVLWKEANGPDFAQLAWRSESDITPADALTPIPPEFLSYYGPGGTAGRILKIALQSGKVVVEWTGGTLESSPDLKGWTPVPGAVSPLSVTPAGRQFYRVSP